MKNPEMPNLATIQKTLQSILLNNQHSASSNFLANYEKGVQQNIQKRKDDWLSQANWTFKDRVSSYTHRLRSYTMELTSANETDFIEKQIKFSKWWMDNADENDRIQQQAYFHLKRYVEFLETTKADLELKENEVVDTTNQPLSFNMGRIQVIALFLLQKDAGLIPPMTDYKLAQWIERNVLYDVDKPMKHVKAEISKFRNYERDPEKYREELLKILNSSTIKVNE